MSGAEAGGLRGAYGRADRFQRRHAWLGFPLAVRQRYSEDSAGYHAASIAYYGFLSVFPLLLLLVTVLGYALAGHPALQRRVVSSALSQFPVVGTQLRVHSLKGNGFALAVGVVGSLWSGMGVALAASHALDEVRGVAAGARANPVRRRVRALLMLLLLGGTTVISTLLTGAATAAGSYGLGARVAAIVLSAIVNFGLFLAAYRILGSARDGWRRLGLGAAVAAVLWTVLQVIGTYLVTRQLQRAGDTYGAFASVIGLLVWLYLGAEVLMIGAETNVIAIRRLWPRSLPLDADQPPTEGDRRALGGEAQ